ncbi:trigger factor [bacterium]|nr:trigger factor [bacterium]
MITEIIKETTTSKSVKFTVSNEDFQKEYNKELKKVSSKIHIDGFRKGKVPVAAVEKRYGKSIRAEVIEKIVDKEANSYLQSLSETITREPKIDNFRELGNNSFSFELDVEFFPHFEIENYKNLQIHIPLKKVTDQDVESYITETFLPSYTTRVDVEGRDILEMGDLAIVDMIAFKNGEKVEDFSRVNFPLELKNDSFAEGLDEKMIGLKVGDSIDFEYAKDPASPLMLNITVKGIQEFQKPAFDDSFVEKYFPGQDGGIEGLKSSIRVAMEHQTEQENNHKMVQTYLSEISEKYQFDIPESVLKNSIAELKSQKISSKQIDPKMGDDEFLESFKDDVLRVSKEIIIMNKLSDVEDFKVEQNDIFNYLTQISQQYNLNDEQIKSILSDKRRYQLLLQDIHFMKIREFIVENNEAVDSTQSNVE